MAPGLEEPMRASSLSMLDHSLSAWSTKETRQAQTRLAHSHWDRFDYQVSDGGGHQFTHQRLGEYAGHPASPAGFQGRDVRVKGVTSF